MTSFARPDRIQSAQIVPSFAGQKGRPGSAKLAGLHLEQQTERLLSEAGLAPICHPWIRYSDGIGTAHCQPDFLIPNIAGRTCIIECKLTWHHYATRQLEFLYKPVVERLFGRPAFYFVICRSAPANVNRAASLSDAIARAPTNGRLALILDPEGVAVPPGGIERAPQQEAPRYELP